MKPVPVLCAFLLLVSLQAAADSVSVNDGKLSAEFTDSELPAALASVGDEAGIEFVVYPSVTGTISAEIDGVPIEAAVRRLLKGYNYAVIFNQSEAPKRIEKVVVMGSAKPAPVAVSAAEAPAAGEVVAEEGEFVIARGNGSGQFFAQGLVNGKPVNFLVDTGANMVTLSSALARRLGLNMQNRVTVGTANGSASGFQVVLPSISVGPLTRENIQAVVLPGLTGDVEALLGMSFLQGLNIEQTDDQMTIKPPDADDLNELITQ